MLVLDMERRVLLRESCSRCRLAKATPPQKLYREYPKSTQQCSLFIKYFIMHAGVLIDSWPLY